MAYRLAKSLEVFRSEVNAHWPDRDKTSDGWIGDAAHASRASDHNPRIKDAKGVGVVRAFDVDAGPGNNREIGRFLAEHVRKLAQWDFPPLMNGGYIISAKKIASAKTKWEWRPYDGSNPHTSHTHVSVGTTPRSYDAKETWGVMTKVSLPLSTVMKRGSRGPEVKELQKVLNRWYPKLKPLVEDDVFGQATEDRVKYFQKYAGLVSDGVVGTKTKLALGF